MEPFKLDFVNLVENSLSENTWNVYTNAEKSFEKFRKNYDLEKVWPVPISHLINFIVYLAKNSYSPNTAKSYIAAIGFKMKMNNLTDSTDSFIVKKLLKGMSKTYKRADIRRPITVEILTDIIGILPQICNSTYEAKLFSAVFVLAFRAFLRIGETVESSKSSHVIQKSDVILNHTDKSVSVTINSSKTDQYGLETKLVLNSEFVNLSIYDQLHQYLSVRPSINGSFFCHFNHEKVTRYQVTVILKSALRFLGYNENDYNTHSFRIGAATHAAKMGKSDDEIMTMGRWKSDSYKRYIRIDTII